MHVHQTKPTALCGCCTSSCSVHALCRLALLSWGDCVQWCSAYGADFIPRKADLTANKAMAHAVSAMFNGPTIAYGKIAGMRMADAQQIAKWKVQQEAAAAAKAAAEAELDRRAAAGTATKATAEGTSPVAGTSC